MTICCWSRSKSHESSRVNAVLSGFKPSSRNACFSVQKNLSFPVFSSSNPAFLTGLDLCFHSTVAHSIKQDMMRMDPHSLRLVGLEAVAQQMTQTQLRHRSLFYRFVSRAAQRYINFSMRRPFVCSPLTGVTVLFSADYVSQALTNMGTDGHWDKQRSLSMACFGFFYYGFVCKSIYMGLSYPKKYLRHPHPPFSPAQNRENHKIECSTSCRLP